jgi:hypothetical protein
MRLFRLHHCVEVADFTFYDSIYGPNPTQAARVSRRDILSAWATLLVVSATFLTVLAS